jgi:hypothetical protein
MEAKRFVEGVFREWESGDSGPFFKTLSPKLIWTAIGSTPISGTYLSKQAYIEKVYSPLLATFSGPTRCAVRQIIGEGQTVVVEWHGETPIASGGNYSQDYCWIIRVDDANEAIVEVRGYFDTDLVSKLLANRNEPSNQNSG